MADKNEAAPVYALERPYSPTLEELRQRYGEMRPAVVLSGLAFDASKLRDAPKSDVVRDYLPMFGV